MALITRPGEARERLCHNAYTTREPGNSLGLLEEALELAEKYEATERELAKARRTGQLRSDDLGSQLVEAQQAGLIDKDLAAELRAYNDKVRALLAVDDFDSAELARTHAAAADQPKSAPARKKKKATKRAAKRKTVSRRKKATKSE